MAKRDKYSLPKSTKKDLAHTIARAGFGSIPVVGSAAAELYNSIIIPPLTKRKDEWMKSISEGLLALEEKNFITIDDLKNNEIFVTTVMHATQAALRSHREEKLNALRNAVLNAALPDSIDDSLQQIFLNFIDIFTTWHIRILKLFDNPSEWATANNIDYSDVSVGSLANNILKRAYPELSDQKVFYEKIWKDLYNDALVSTDSLNPTVTGRALLSRQTTDLGHNFILFISDPT